MFQSTVLIALIAIAVSCNRTRSSSRDPIPHHNFTPSTTEAPRTEESQRRHEQEATAERKNSSDGIVSSESRDKILSSTIGSGPAHIGILYFLDRPSHETAVLNWLKDHNAKVHFWSPRFGYVDADLDWSHIKDLIATAGDLGLDTTSLMKLEIDEPRFSKSGAADEGNPDGQGAESGNSSFIGPVHSAGYGAHLAEFRNAAAKDLGISVDALAGQGRTIAVYDSTMDLSWSNVYQDRIRDIFVGEESNWFVAELKLKDFLAKDNSPTEETPKGLEDVAHNDSLRFALVSKKALKEDVNGTGKVGDVLVFAVYEVDGRIETRFRPIKGMAFGDPLSDFGVARKAGKPTLINAYSGRYFDRSTAANEAGAFAVKIRKDAEHLWIAPLGHRTVTNHGIANLHMAGGNYRDATGKTLYQGAAPGVDFFIMQTWGIDRSNYGDTWLPLARTMIAGADAGADVLDLDIATPGTRIGNDLLSHLVCRITSITNTVPVVAAHNYGPLADTIQSLAQSPCVLAVGASLTKAALAHGNDNGIVNPGMEKDDDVMTASYSGRGFAMNGQLKPDIISPAYGYTPYGMSFTRFGGTSGATPTTAGIIALLKQAAGAHRVELNFEQIKRILQASSTPVNADHPRDGFGYTHALRAWETYRKISANTGGKFELAPVTLTGQTYFHFEGRPSIKKLTVALRRVATSGSVNVPVPMKFWIEYGGASKGAESTRPWLKFWDATKFALSDTLQLDAPIVGELQNLTSYIDMDESSWAAMPPGDHIAIIKGVRQQGAAGRMVDFAMPVTINKPLHIDFTQWKIKPLYAMEYETISVQTTPGDMLMIYGTPSCKGELLGSGNDGQIGDGLEISIDHEKVYKSASEISNFYSNFYLTENPIRVIAKRNNINLSISRYRGLNCRGAVSGTVTIRRVGVNVQADLQFNETQKDGVLSIQKPLSVTLTGAGLINGEQRRNVSWDFSIDKSQDNIVVLRKKVTAAWEATIPFDAIDITVVPETAEFKGALRMIGLGGRSEVSMPVSTRSGGFDSLSVDSMFGYSGIQFKDVKAGTKVSLDTPTAAPVTLVIRVANVVQTALMMTPSTGITAWSKGEEKKFMLSAKLPRTRPAAFDAEDFNGSSWTYSLEPTFTIKEQPTKPLSNILTLPTTLWSGTAVIAVPW